MQCYLFEAPTYFFFAPDIPELLYYSHLPTMALALLVGFFVFWHKPTRLLNRLLLGISLSFSAWILLSLLSWTNINGDLIAAFWPFFGVLAGLLSILSIYFVYVFLYDQDISNRLKLIFLTLLFPVFLFAHTDLSLSGFNLANCDAFDHEGLLYKGYYTGLGFMAFVWILALMVARYRKATTFTRSQILLLGVGIELFLFSFIFIVFIVTYLTSLGYFADSRLEMYGLFGMTFFMVMLGALIVRSKRFSVRIHVAEALTIALVILIASQYTYINSSTTTIVLTSVTLVLTAVAGIYLNRSVRNEIKQREHIEELAKELARANKRLRKLDKAKSEFVSIASHQLRSPLTAMRGYASMLLEGSYGKIPKKAEQVIGRIADSGKNMALLVEDYLNVSRIESGNMKYDLEDFNLAEEAKRVVDDKRQEAVRNGLLLMYKSDIQQLGLVHADRSKVVQILHNLINNALKYTPKGSVTVYVHEDSKTNHINVDIIDTGVGMTEEEADSIFGKFERAAGASKVNTSGTGLGLYVAKAMTEHMSGTVSVTSPGAGKGSTFRVSFPLIG